MDYRVHLAGARIEKARDAQDLTWGPPAGNAAFDQPFLTARLMVSSSGDTRTLLLLFAPMLLYA